MSWSLNHVKRDLVPMFQAELLVEGACGHGVCVVLNCDRQTSKSRQSKRKAFHSQCLYLHSTTNTATLNTAVLLQGFTATVTVRPFGKVQDHSLH